MTGKLNKDEQALHEMGEKTTPDQFRHWQFFQASFERDHDSHSQKIRSTRSRQGLNKGTGP